MKKSRKWVKEHLVCEFTHYDFCLSGLVFDQKYKVCIIDKSCYLIFEINWTCECDEYLADYKLAYHHWFKDGKAYDGRDLSWFKQKWNGRNPIMENKIL